MCTLHWHQSRLTCRSTTKANTQREKDFVDLILKAYKAQKVEGVNNFFGKKADRLVAIGLINLPVTKLYVEELLLECRTKHIGRVEGYQKRYFFAKNADF